jgi:cytochrome d ubiquinol oxidase subunit II
MSFSYLEANGVFLKVVIAAMVTFLFSEFIAIYPIFSNYEKHKTVVLKHIVPIWEITGTMIVFFVVELELIYSGLVPISSYLFIPVIGLFVALLILRNVAIIYSEFIWKKVDSKPLMMFYSAATFLMVIGFVTAIAALMVGNSVSTAIPSLPPLLHLDLANLSKSYVDYIALLTAPVYSAVYWEFLFGTLFIAFGMSQVFYRIAKRTSYIPLFAIILGLFLNVNAWNVVATLAGAKFMGDYMILPVIIAIAIPLLYMYKPTTNLASYKPFWFIVMTIAVLFLELPITRIAGGAYSINTFASSNSMLVANFWLSMIGGILFLLLMIMYAYVYNSGRMSITPENIEKTNKSNAEATEKVVKNETQKN